MCDEPWYQCRGPSEDSVIAEHVEFFKEKCTCGHDELVRIVTKHVRDESKRYGGLGSFRGYATFVLAPLRRAIQQSLADGQSETKSTSKVRTPEENVLVSRDEK